MQTPPVVLTIAGSDAGGGAGIQADLKTFAAHGVFGTSVLTAVTAQNTQGVQAIEVLPAAFVRAQFESVWTDFPVAAIKIGMLATAEIVTTIAECLKDVRVPIVLDPVMKSTSGHTLLAPAAIEALAAHLLPLATLVTPNAAEVGLLLGRPIATAEALKEALPDLAGLVPGVTWLAKGGHLPANGQATDWLWASGTATPITTPWVATPNTHGTGCTLSSAIAANLALGQALLPAVQRAKSYLQATLLAAPIGLGKGAGPLWHGVTPPSA